MKSLNNNENLWINLKVEPLENREEYTQLPGIMACCAQVCCAQCCAQCI